MMSAHALRAYLQPSEQFLRVPVSAGGCIRSVWSGTHRRQAEREDLKSDSEYNLYNHKGLPPGPICNPGYASLYAASHPEDNNYYYYVAMPDGSHLFASSYEEHERNIEASNQAQAQAANASADTTTTEATGE